MKGQVLPANVSAFDRTFRATVIAPIAAVLAWIAGFDSVLGILLLIVAAYTVATAAIGSCPVYTRLGVDTSESESPAI